MVKNPQANAVLEHIHQVLRQMLHMAEIDMADLVTPDDVDVSLTMWCGPFAQHIIQYLKPHQARQYSDVTCSSTYRS